MHVHAGIGNVWKLLGQAIPNNMIDTFLLGSLAFNIIDPVTSGVNGYISGTTSSFSVLRIFRASLKGCSLLKKLMVRIGDGAINMRDQFLKSGTGNLSDIVNLVGRYKYNVRGLSRKNNFVNLCCLK